MKKILYGLLLATLLSTVTFGNVKQLGASGTIYIRADGSVQPPTAPIQRNGALYTFTSDIKDSIVVEKSDIVIDGSDHVLEGAATGTGVSLSNIADVTIANITIKAFDCAIELYKSSACTVIENTIAMNYQYGIRLDVSSGNNITGNNITLNNYNAITLLVSSDNSIIGNNLTANKYGGIAVLDSSSNNTVLGNNIIENKFEGVNIESQTPGGVNTYNNSVFQNIITGNQDGIRIKSSSNNTIIGNEITASSQGIVVVSSSGNYLAENNMTNNEFNIRFDNSSDNHVRGNTISLNYVGLWLQRQSSNNNLSNNVITTNTGYGVSIEFSDSNSIVGNTVLSNGIEGVHLSTSSNNNISANTICNNSVGTSLNESSNNSIYRNNFLNNINQVSTAGSMNFWDNGYPSGGNYWSDYEGTGTEPYVIDPNNIDHYPLRVPEATFPVFWKQAAFGFLVTGSNITVARFYVNDANKVIGFKTVGQGYVNLTIPREYSDGFFKVFINDIQIPCMSTCDNTYTSIYFECKTSSLNIVKIEAQMKFLGDVNGDGQVNIIDISIVAKHFGQKLNP